MTDIQKLTRKIKEFNEKREWGQFHNPKDLSISLSIEASEVLEHFQWKTLEEIKEYAKNKKEELGEELADVAIYLFQLAAKLSINLGEAIEDKIAKNDKKYPISKSKGSAKKYTEYE